MQNRIIYIMGVSGSGKTTIGKLLSANTGIPFFDGDDLHSPANKKKMIAGNPLTDEDRESWLQQINLLAIEQQTSGGAIIACSALKERYRYILNKKIHSPYWIFLNGDFEVIHERMKKRDHFMPPGLLLSQFGILETPVNALIIDINKKPEEIVDYIQEKIGIP
jgi:carbohydrate kinase (thermoresistant glucokinase family)